MRLSSSSILSKILIVVVLLISDLAPFAQTLTSIISPYHLSSSKLSWRSASNYCRNICLYSLASIHSAFDHNQTVARIQTSCSMNKTCPHLVWIGLYYSDYDKVWRWADYTSFDYGNPNSTNFTDSFNNPWIDNISLSDFSPSDFSCVLINVDADYKWDIRNGDECEMAQTFLCNDCAPFSNRYTIMDGVVATYDDGEVVCQTELNTHLISIHSEEDYLEAKLLCLYGTNRERDCWTGLRESTLDPDQYQWSDGSEWDYALDTYSYPFSPGNNPIVARCVALWSDDDYLLRNALCTQKKQVLCDSPDSTMEPTKDTEESTTTETTEEGGSEKKSSKAMTLASLIIAIVVAVAAILLLLWIIEEQKKGGMGNGNGSGGVGDGNDQSKYRDDSKYREIPNEDEEEEEEVNYRPTYQERYDEEEKMSQMKRDDETTKEPQLDRSGGIPNYASRRSDIPSTPPKAKKQMSMMKRVTTGQIFRKKTNWEESESIEEEEELKMESDYF